MIIPRSPHSWSLTPRAAIAVQRKMAALVSLRAEPGEIRLVAGLDAAFSADGRQCLAAVVLWDLQARQVLEQRTARRKLSFPYIPGLLSFREAPALLAALRKLVRIPDALICDGQGMAHPRRFGIACHVGVLCRLPAIGCAKSRLVGTETLPSAARGARTDLVDKGEVIGSVLRTQEGIKPVYVSIGHKLDLAMAERIVLACSLKRRLPEPTRLADRLVAAVKRSLASGS